MAEFCVLRLAGNRTGEWLVVDADGQARSGVERGPLTSAADSARGRRLVVLVPGSDVTLAEPEVPLRAGRLLAAVPFALEESLAGDIEQMHFAIGRPDGRLVPTAAVERARLAGWLEELATAGLAPQALYADSMVLPVNPSHTVLVCDGPRLYARTPQASGVVLDAAPLAAGLRLVGLPPAPDAGAQTHVLVYTSDADWQANHATFEALRDSVATLNVQVLADGVLPLLAAGAVVAPPFSLLQGSFAPRGDWGSQWARWRLAAALAGVFVVLQVATQIYSLVHLKAEQRQLEQQTLAVVRDAMPDLSNPQRLPNLRAVAEGRVRALATTGQGGLLGALSATAQALGQAADTRVSSVSYHDGTTDLTLEAPDVGAIDRFQQAINTQGLHALMQGTTQHESRYQGHVQVKGSG